MLFDKAPDNTIGRSAAGAGNILSKSGLGRPPNGFGVIIDGAGATGDLVQDNFIGTDLTGTLDGGNFDDGVIIVNAPDNAVGGATTGDRNVLPQQRRVQPGGRDDTSGPSQPASEPVGPVHLARWQIYPLGRRSL